MSAVQGLTQRLAWLLLLGTAIAGCDEGTYKDRVYGSVAADDAGRPPRDAGSAPDAGSQPVQPYGCQLAVSSDSIPPRASVMSSRQNQNATGVFTRDLFNLFRSHCGGCHVDQGLGDLQVTLQNFSMTVTGEVLDRIRSDDETKFMPPRASAGKPFTERSPGDPVIELASLIESWLAAGSPVDVFYPDAPQSGVGAEPFALTPDVGMAMTNLGNCIPSSDMVGSEKAKSAELDTLFEKMTKLPERLEQTDLISLDSQVLARHGVVAFAPAYTLWADNAKKTRWVRVPRGEAIKFDKATQTFDVPPNTRFYKTFYKRVIDHRGNESYRKLETRLIVSRPDIQLADGSYEIASLFGTYAWNESETEAVLLRDPLRNGEPFRDRLITYITDEQAAEEIIAKGPENLQEELEDRGLARTWALPGSARCVHCHMGAPNKSFVLGFTPLQLMRRPLDEGGVIEPAARDELSQLQRLIDYGLISGMTSPEEVLGLEDGQGERKARNAYELKAQGYLLGNCAHCHNPRGFPSVVAPELRDMLNFDPTTGGGIFQFPLDRVSPRIFRGPLVNHAMPYLSPGLYDVPKEDGVENADAKVVGTAGCEVGLDGTVNGCYRYLPAPWRSVIYRNIDTPFSYSEDSAIFPHMPMDTAGYDCRARQLIGEWMVSIPVRWKYSAYVPAGTANPPRRLYEWEFAPPTIEDPQPYEEVRPGEPGYKSAELSATTRTRMFQESPRYNDCPPSSNDIVDPKVVRGEAIVPGPTTAWPDRDKTGKVVLDGDGNPTGYYSLSVPERAHLADTDLTQAPGEWYPRRPDWQDVLVADLDQTPAATPQEAKVVELLQQVMVKDDFRSLALSEAPFGLWLKKDECDFSKQAKVDDFKTNAPRWMAGNRFLKPTEPVYTISPGGMVFSSICANCHGPKADSQGRLAATIADMTGGQTRVANLRDGLFGPPAMQGANLDRVFGFTASSTLSAEDWAARYVLWMGLGGTQRIIPPAALTVVGSTRILGVARKGALAVKDANMLSAARNLCAAVLERLYLDFEIKTGEPDYSGSALITTNGDAEMWEKLCTYENPLPVVRVEVTAGGGFRTQGGVLYPRTNYPPGALVGDPAQGITNGIQASNSAPWCLVRPSSADLQAKLDAAWKREMGEAGLPYCPDSLLPSQNEMSADQKEAFTLRGALNAGLSVFLYLQALTRGEKQPSVPYDRCEELASP